MTEPFAEDDAPEVVAPGAPEADVVDPAAEAAVVDPEVVNPEVVDPDAEIVDGLPVLAEVRTIERPSHASLPAVQAAAAAATGFVAGAATIALIRRRSARKTTRNGKNGSRRVADLLPITASRSFLVDVHVIGKQGD